jgi:uncharacterized protein
MTRGAAPTGTVLAPVSAGRRIEAIDTLRGFALLGILVMNITGIAFPMAAYFNPLVYGGSTGADFGAWVFAHLFFDLKMMGIFSMLFGAGVVLMAERAAASGRPLAAIWYRRVLWLGVIGLVHAYLLWHGDILVTYALCGLVLYLFRRRSARALIVAGLCVLVFGALLTAGGGYALAQLRDVASEIEAKVAAGEEMTPRRQELVDQWNDVAATSAPTPEMLQRAIATMRGAPSEVLAANVEETIAMHTQAVPFMLFWRALALMLLGMGLMKAGVFTGERSSRFYRGWAIAGFAIGLPVVAFGIHRRSLEGYGFHASFLESGQYNHFASVLVSLGWVGVVMLTCQAGRLVGLRARLAAVGRMALTNYLAQTVLCVAAFHGYGLGLYGQVSRLHLWWFILAIWIVQLAWSPWWLARYRFGPAEWLWRSLTYSRRQPMRVAPVGG